MRFSRSPSFRLYRGGERQQGRRRFFSKSLPARTRRRGQDGLHGHHLRLLLVSLLGGVAALLLLSTTAMAVGYLQVSSSLRPRLEAIQEHQPFQSSRIYDRHGTLLFEIFDAGRREPVPLNVVSQQLIDATIAIEDASFYHNSGVDYQGILRAVYQNLTNQAEVSGASTITQQVIKNVVLTPEERAYQRRYERKLKELILAQELNNTYSKNRILELYLNEIPYGNLAYGIQAAAKSYFGISATELNLAQASLLAGLPQSPSYYNPIQYLGEDATLPGLRLATGWLDPAYQPAQAVPPPKLRQMAVLRQMVLEGYISEDQAVQAAAQDLSFSDQEFSLLAPHFVFYVKEHLEQKYGVEAVSQGGLQITTTLDLELQNMVQEEARRRIAELEAGNRNIHNAAGVVLQPNTGQILAMVGSVGYTRTLETTTPGEEGNVLDGKVNVTTRQRQPGSALKPFTYLAGMEQNIRYDGTGLYPGINPGSILLDLRTKFKNGTEEGYRPENFDRKWHGPMRMRMALANSLNMPAVKALKRAGIDNLINLLHRAGVEPDSLSRGSDYYGLALTLGGGEVTPLGLATAYNTLASAGRYFPPTPILKVTDASGRVLEEFEPQPIPAQPDTDTSRCVPPTIEEYNAGTRMAPGTQCIDPRLAFIITDMLADNQARATMFGSNTAINLNPPAAVKTGTTDDFRDAWASGFTPFVTITVWTGNNNNEPTDSVESVTGGGVIWARLMQRIRASERLMQLLGEPFGGQAPQTFPAEFPGVIARQVCHIPGSFGGPTFELFTEDMQTVPSTPDEKDENEEILSWDWENGGRATISESFLRRCDASPGLRFAPPGPDS